MLYRRWALTFAIVGMLASGSVLPAEEAPVEGTLHALGAEFQLKHVVAFRGTLDDRDKEVVTVVASPEPIDLEAWRAPHHFDKPEVCVTVEFENSGKLRSSWLQTKGAGQGASRPTGDLKIVDGRCEGWASMPNYYDKVSRKEAEAELEEHVKLFEKFSKIVDFDFAPQREEIRVGRREFNFRFRTPLLSSKEPPQDKRLAVKPGPNTGWLEAEGRRFQLTHVVAFSDPAEEGEGTTSLIASNQPIKLAEFLKDRGRDWEQPFVVITFDPKGNPFSIDGRAAGNHFSDSFWQSSSYLGDLKLQEGHCAGRVWRLKHGKKPVRDFEMDLSFDLAMSPLPTSDAPEAGDPEVAKSMEAEGDDEESLLERAELAQQLADELRKPLFTVVRHAAGAVKMDNRTGETWILRVDPKSKVPKWARIGSKTAKPAPDATVNE